jgi:hypothetical protein
MKNTLLNFLPEKGALQILSVQPDATYQAVTEKGTINLLPVSSAARTVAAKKVRFALAREMGELKELTAMEVSGGTLRTLSEDSDFRSPGSSSDTPYS